jgi:Na+/proline symporter
MTPAVHRWIETLPLRWALGGLVFGAAIALFLFAITEPWSIDSIPWLMGALMQVLLPSAALGLLWGWHERRAMRAALANGPVIMIIGSGTSIGSSRPERARPAGCSWAFFTSRPPCSAYGPPSSVRSRNSR